MRLLNIISVILTVILVLGGSFYTYCNWSKVVILTPNEIGDSLAGFFAPLAFLWIIAGYIQNTEALKLQYRELMNSVEQQRIMATSAQEDNRLLLLQLKTQRDRDLFAAQPSFRLRKILQVPSPDDEFKVNLELINVGCGITILDLKQLDPASDLKLGAFSASNLPLISSHLSEGQRIRIEFQWPKGYSDEVDAELTFRDGLRIKQTYIISISRTNNTLEWTYRIDDSLNQS